MILLVTLLGFLGAAGVHRILLNQIGMGIIYFFTAGFCLIGTIVDLINYQQLTFSFNRQVAIETSSMLSSTN
jgi:TM2 domain-containing membrane protein YozV